jgi:hypothetical protein
MMKNAMTQSNPHRKPLTALLAVSATVFLACTNQAPSGSSDEAKVVQSPIISACSQQTLGLPCDPDQNGPATECEGVCWVDTDLHAICATLANMGMAVTDLNGRICGDSLGRDCSQSCENGLCVAKNARLGTACRPTASLSSCDGLCTLISGNPTCDPVTACDSVGVQGCTLRACGFSDNTTGCLDYTLAAGTSCSDGLACTTGDTCNANGACVPTSNNCGGAGGQGGAGGVAGGTAGEGGIPTGGTAGTTAGSAGAPKGGSAGTTAGSAGAPKAGSAGTTAGSAGAPKAGSAGAPKAGSAGKATGGAELVVVVPSGERVKITGGGCATSRSRTPGAGFGLLMLLGIASYSRRRTRRSA